MGTAGWLLADASKSVGHNLFTWLRAMLAYVVDSDLAAAEELADETFRVLVVRVAWDSCRLVLTDEARTGDVADSPDRQPRAGRRQERASRAGPAKPTP
jgi:hypothetical protein